MNSDLQAIMARRRRLADSAETKESEPLVAPSNNQQQRAMEESLADLGTSASDLRSRSTDSDSHISHSNNMSMNLQEVLERRRRVADGGEAATSHSRPPLSPSGRFIPHSAPVSHEKASPVKENLKGVPMSSDLQSIMARRRRAADGEEPSGTTDSAASAVDTNVPTEPIGAESHDEVKTQVDEGNGALQEDSSWEVADQLEEPFNDRAADGEEPSGTTDSAASAVDTNVPTEPIAPESHDEVKTQVDDGNGALQEDSSLEVTDQLEEPINDIGDETTNEVHNGTSEMDSVVKVAKEENETEAVTIVSAVNDSQPETDLTEDGVVLDENGLSQSDQKESENRSSKTNQEAQSNEEELNNLSQTIEILPTDLKKTELGNEKDDAVGSAESMQLEESLTQEKSNVIPDAHEETQSSLDDEHVAIKKKKKKKSTKGMDQTPVEEHGERAVLPRVASERNFEGAVSEDSSDKKSEESKDDTTNNEVRRKKKKQTSSKGQTDTAEQNSTPASLVLPASGRKDGRRHHRSDDELSVGESIRSGESAGGKLKKNDASSGRHLIQGNQMTKSASSQDLSGRQHPALIKDSSVSQEISRESRRSSVSRTATSRSNDSDEILRTSRRRSTTGRQGESTRSIDSSEDERRLLERASISQLVEQAERATSSSRLSSDEETKIRSNEVATFDGQSQMVSKAAVVKEQSSSVAQRSLEVNPISDSNHDGFGAFSNDFTDADFGPLGGEKASTSNVDPFSPLGGDPFAQNNVGADYGPSLSGPSNSLLFGGIGTKPNASFDMTSSNFGVEAFAFESAFGSAFDAGSDPFIAVSKAQDKKSHLETTVDGKATQWTSSGIENPPKRPKMQVLLQQTGLLRHNFHTSPVTNPLNGNVILCTSDSDGIYLREIDHYRGNLQLNSLAVHSSELQRMVASKLALTLYRVVAVSSLTVGLHKANGQYRVRLAAFVELFVLEYNRSFKVVAVWQWGYGSPTPVLLQHLLKPPDEKETRFDESTLQIADNLVFLGGSVSQQPCIFISKPAVRETWSVNPLIGCTSALVRLTVNTSHDRRFPYLATAFADKSLRVWTYAEALKNPSRKGGENSERWIFPLCSLSAVDILIEVDASSPSDDNNIKGLDSRNLGQCTHFSWFYDKRASDTGMLFLATSFQNALAVFHVSLPVLHDPAKNGVRALPNATEKTLLSQTVELAPVLAKRWLGNHDSSWVSWMPLGPYNGLGLFLVFQNSESTGRSSRFSLGIIDFPSPNEKPIAKEKFLPFRIWASSTLPKSSEFSPLGILDSRSLDRVICFGSSCVFQLHIAVTPDKDSLCSYFDMGVTSNPPGLDTLGNPLLVDASSDKEGILNVLATYQCERLKSKTGLLEWTKPSRRYWLCKAYVGDSKEAHYEETKQDEKDFNASDAVTGGASAESICELYSESLAGFSPCRIVRCVGNDVCAVVFTPRLEDTLSALDGNLICLVDFSGPVAKLNIVEGQDISFFPSNGTSQPEGLILSRDGGSLSHFRWEGKSVVIGVTYRPILGVETDNDYIDCRRIFVFSGASKVSLICAGVRLRDNRYCAVLGGLCDASKLGSSWKTLLPNIVTNHSALFGSGEEILSVIGLECDDNGYRNFAIATGSRVIIMSSALETIVEAKTMASSGALAPIGPFGVCYANLEKVDYLCCLDGTLASGTIASLPTFNYNQGPSLLALRPDRVLLSPALSVTSLVEYGQSSDNFLLPPPVTRPVLLLEPLVANAVCVGGKTDQSTAALRSVIEKFGRKQASISHGENEGIGHLGAGMTARIFEILGLYGLKHASSWLLTGVVNFNRVANSQLQPNWLPVAAKARAGRNSDAFLHLISNGDIYFSDYIKSPDQNVAPSMPRPSDPSSYLCSEFAWISLKEGNVNDMLKMIDIPGSEASDTNLLQIFLLLSKGQKTEPASVLKTIAGYGQSGLKNSGPTATSTSLAVLAYLLKTGMIKNANMKDDDVERYIKSLSPSFNRSRRVGRVRQKLLDEKEFRINSDEKVDTHESVWMSPCNDSKHIWNEGLNRHPECLMMLDSVQDWLGRKRPIILGKDGVSAARERGEKTLASILNVDEDSFGGKSDLEDEQDGWVDGVGEGRSDEANLSGYFRMSEGEDEDSLWRIDGLSDISHYQNRALIVGNTEAVNLQPSTSSVDEGEPGKVKSLYDLVFEKSGVGTASGLALPAFRGGSLDVGVLHNASRHSRQRCTIEFWYWLPPRSATQNEIVLVRRTFGPSADDFSQVAVAAERNGMLWELILCPSGQLEFRTCEGSSILSSMKRSPSKKLVEDNPNEERKDAAQFDRWNHVCLTVSSKDMGITECDVTLLIKGNEVARATMSVQPPGFDKDELDSDSALDEVMRKSHLFFGLNHSAGFRLTEIRIWACERSPGDVQALMYEYLNAAEAKKKFKVKIKNKRIGVGSLGKGLVAGATGAKLGGHKAGGKGLSLAPTKGISLAPNKPLLAQPPSVPEKGVLPSPLVEDKVSVTPGLTISERHNPTAFEATSSTFTTPMAVKDDTTDTEAEAITRLRNDKDFGEEEEEAAATLWDTALPISQQVKASAAAALIRGPPATRHFGGNRGGLPDFIGIDRFGVGGIAICGSEKTIVWRDNEDPPALTYPIGSSGAIVSDQMDDEGSEFLCCFLAKERRMVVFELQSRTVVVELQMTTKLNFWRFLPPESAGNTLCFMLVTPVGGFHWMPLEESPRPHQVWKRGTTLQGKKIVSYEEGGSNGLEGSDILSRVGLVMATQSSGAGSLEAWIIPIAGDSKAVLVSDDVMGACLCLPPFSDEGSFMPLLLTVHLIEEGIFINIITVSCPARGSVSLGEIEVTQEIDLNGLEDLDYEPPSLAMGTYPEALCCSLANIFVVIIRRKGLIIAFELEDGEMSLIAQEDVGHYVIDACMRYSAEVGGVEIVMLLADNENPKDGRMVSFCFRSAEGEEEH